MFNNILENLGFNLKKSIKSSECLILLYHRVIELKYDPQLLTVSPDNFYDQIKYLKKYYNLITHQEFFFHLDQQIPFPDNSILITFDDGYFDNYTNALPILETLSAQAIFFISTGYIGTKNEYWWDKVEALFNLANFKKSYTKKFKIDNVDHVISNKESLLLLYNSTLERLRSYTVVKRENVINNLSDYLNININS